MAPSENLELARLQLEDNRACHPRFFARSRPKLFCKAPDHWLSFCQQHVALKSILDGYRLGRPVRDDLVMVDTEGKLVQALTIPAEVLFEYGQVESSEIPYRLCSKFRQLLSRNFADARQASNRQWQQKRVYVLRQIGTASCR